MGGVLSVMSSVRDWLATVTTILAGCLIGHFLCFVYNACRDLFIEKPHVVIKNAQWVVCVVTWRGPRVYTCATRRKAERLFGTLRDVTFEARAGRHAQGAHARVWVVLPVAGACVGRRAALGGPRHSSGGGVVACLAMTAITRLRLPSPTAHVVFLSLPDRALTRRRA